MNSEQKLPPSPIHSKNNWTTALPAVLSVIIGLLPNFMPDAFKSGLQNYLGSNYEYLWAGFFILIAVVLVVVTYRSSKHSSGAFVKNTKISKVSSKGHSKIESSKEGNFEANQIESGKNSEITTKNAGSVNIDDVTSDGDTIIKSNDL